MPKPIARLSDNPVGRSPIRLTALDFDGTLVPKDVPNVDLDDRTVALLEQLRRQGMRLIVATGWHPSFILKRVRKFRFDAIVGYSGNVTAIQDQLQAAVFNGETLLAFSAFARQLPGVDMTLYSDQGIACGGSPESREALVRKWRRTDRICDLNGVADFLIGEVQKVRGMRVSRVCLRFDSWERYPQVRTTFQSRFPGFRLVKTGDRQAEVLAQGRSKASEILRLALGLGISEDQIACAGDDENDMEMLRLFHHSYYIGRDDDPLRRTAAFCANNVTAVLEQLLIKGDNHV